MTNINQLRNKFSQSRNKPVSIDSFIFSVSEAEAYLKSAFRERKELACSELDSCLSVDENPIEALEKVFSWYLETYPSLNSKEPLDYVMKEEISTLVASLRFDLDESLRFLTVEYPFFDTPVPEKEMSEPEEGASLEEPSENKESAVEVSQEESSTDQEPELENFYDERTEETTEASSEEMSSEASSGAQEPDNLPSEAESSEEEEPKAEPVIEDLDPVLQRTEFERAVQNIFPHYASYFLAYFDWSYAEPFVTEPDFDSLPPSGRGLYLIRRAFPSSEIVWGKKALPVNQEPQETYTKSTRFEEKKALEEVNEAVKKLKRDKRVSSVKLSPQNSFMRRLQHKVVHQNGFDSKSSGKEPERYLTIIR